MSYSKYIEDLYRPLLEKTDRASYTCLDKNEAPFSAFDNNKNLITSEDIYNLKSYPNPFFLYEDLSSFLNIDIDNILLTQGSEQAIDFVFRVFLSEDDTVVFLEPSFAMFDVFAFQNKAKVKTIKFDENMTLNINKVLDSITVDTKLFALANPNNPTGTAFTEKELYAIARHTKKINTIFLLDEAYFYYFSVNSLAFIKEFDNIIITRTFSKAFGLAGSRVGYAISNTKNINLLRKVKPIDELNSLSIILAQKALLQADEILNKNITQVEKWKEIFFNTPLDNMEYIKTEGNFILLKSFDFDKHKKIFLDNKILPKMGFPQEYLKSCIRFSITEDIIMFKILDLLKDK